MRRARSASLMVVILTLVALYLIKLKNSVTTPAKNLGYIDFSNFNNTAAGFSKLIVPNIVHYIVFDEVTLSFPVFICILSAWFHQRPAKIIIHTNHKFDKDLRYIKILDSVMGSSLLIRKVIKPTHVFGIPIPIVMHSADVQRLLVLQEYGGIYLDWDVYVLKSLNQFRHYECVVGWPDDGINNLGNQVIIAHKDSRFIDIWVQSYRDYHPHEWYYNGGELPTKILKMRPELVHRAKWEFGVQTVYTGQIYKEFWPDYAKRYTLHLLTGHAYLQGDAKLTQDEYKNTNCTFTVLVDIVLDQLTKQQKSMLNSKQSDYEIIANFISDKIRNFGGHKPRKASLLKIHLTSEKLDPLMKLRTEYNTTLMDVIKTGLVNADSSVGVFAPDAASYNVFKNLLLPIIGQYHNVAPIEEFKGQPPLTWGRLNAIGKFGDEVISTRIRIARSISGFPLNSKMSRQNLLDLQNLVKNALTTNFDGSYLPLNEMDEKTRLDLIDRHLLFDECDRFNKGGGGCQFWPDGRAIFLSSDEKFLVWVNEEDHLRIISMDKGGDLNAIYSRLVNSMNKLEKSLKFMHDDLLGFLTFCPTNVGTTLRASVHIKFNNINIMQVEEEAKKLELQVRGTHGEHSDVKGGVMDLSNIRRLGLTEFEAIDTVYKGVKKLIQLDRENAS